jgi:nitrogen fixation NifU-like protein
MDLKALYQDLIVDHKRNPKNFRAIAGASRSAEGHNPLCGDRLTLYLDLDGDTIRDIAFQGAGCAISTASASLMTERLKGRTVAEAHALFARMHDLLTKDQAPDADLEGLGKLAALSGVREFPTRIKCAVLSWHTLRAALSDDHATVSTE